MKRNRTPAPVATLDPRELRTVSGGRTGNDVPEHLKKDANNTVARMQDIL